MVSVTDQPSENADRVTDQPSETPDTFLTAIVRNGLVLKVLRPVYTDTITTASISNTYALLAVRGVVDYVGLNRAQYVVTPFSDVEGSDNAPPVWLLRDRMGLGHRCIVPCDEDGQPLHRTTKQGRNFAYANDPTFWQLVGHHYGAVSIWDEPIDGETGPVWDKHD